MMETRESVKEKIRRSFSSAPIPTSIVDVSTGDRKFRAELHRALGGRDWSEISPDVLTYHHDAIGFLEPAGAAYLLPAFMIAAIDSPSSPLIDVLVGALTKPFEQGEAKKFLERWSRLTRPQRDAVIAFLVFLNEGSPHDWPDREPLVAVDSYWRE